MALVMFSQLATEINFIISTERKSAFISAVRAPMLKLLMLSEVGFYSETFFIIFTGVKKVRMLMFDVFLQIFFVSKYHAGAVRTFQFSRLIKGGFVQHETYLSDGSQPTWPAHSFVKPDITSCVRSLKT